MYMYMCIAMELNCKCVFTNIVDVYMQLCSGLNKEVTQYLSLFFLGEGSDVSGCLDKEENTSWWRNSGHVAQPKKRESVLMLRRPGYCVRYRIAGSHINDDVGCVDVHVTCVARPSELATP